MVSRLLEDKPVLSTNCFQISFFLLRLFSTYFDRVAFVHFLSTTTGAEIGLSWGRVIYSMSQVQSVLFDMDGVLVDSESFWQQFWRSQIFPHTKTGNPTLEDVNGRNFRESLEDLAATYGLSAAPGHYARQFERAAETVYGEQVSMTPGIPEFFATLRDRDVNVGIVSSAPADWIKTVIERFDLAPIDVLVSAEHIDLPGKPEPFIYEHAAAELDVSPSTCLVIEDSVNGVRAAAQAGSTVIRFCHGASVQATDHTDVVANSPAELRRTIFDFLS